MTSNASPTVDLSRVQIFFGDANNAEARVYARLTSGELRGDEQLVGTVVGPRCAYSHTLSASIPLVARGKHPSLLAEAIVPDPCFWSPDLPFLYDARIELRRGSEVAGSITRTFGIRPLGIRGRRLVFDAHALVLRAVRMTAVPKTPLASWREAAAALDVVDPSPSLLEEASRTGVWVVARLSERCQDIPAALEELSKWPAVAIVVLPAETEPALDATPFGNLILAQAVSPKQTPVLAPWASAVVYRIEDADDDLADQASRWTVPLLLQRPAENFPDLRQARAACDLLQRDTAGRGDFSGYIV
jgi:hypothetical protein